MILADQHGNNINIDNAISTSLSNEYTGTVSDPFSDHTYPASKSSPSNESKDSSHPLITLMKIKPHSMKLLIQPSTFYPNTKVRVNILWQLFKCFSFQIQLHYERVRHTLPPLLHHLDHPVREIVNLKTEYQEHELSNLPVGKYIVCGDAQIDGQVFQENCFETIITKLDNNSKYFFCI